MRRSLAQMAGRAQDNREFLNLEGSARCVIAGTLGRPRTINRFGISKCGSLRLWQLQNRLRLEIWGFRKCC